MRAARAITVQYLADAPGHTLACARWEHEEWGIGGGNSLDDAVRPYAAAKRDGLPLTLIACRGGMGPVGMVSLWDSDCPLRPELAPWVASLFVAPAARGRGIGTLLFSRIGAEARRFGITRLYLMTQHSERVYARQGWVTFDRIDGPGAMRNAVLMRLDLTGNPTDL